MLFGLITAVITALGGIAFALLSLFSPSPAGDFFFFTSAVVFLAGPMMFLGYVLLALLAEFWSLHVAAASGASYAFAAPASEETVVQAAWTPEGLLRTPKGPLSPSRGRSDQ